MKYLYLLLCTLLGFDVMAQTSQPSEFTKIRQELQKKWPDNRTVNLVFHGHSVPSGYANTPNVKTLQAYPHQVLEAVKEMYPYAVVNSITTSIGGENAEQGAKRFRREVLPHRPDVLFIDYALNDRSIGLERAQKAWEKMIKEAQKQHIKVILFTPTPDLTEDILDDNSPLEQHSRQIRRLAHAYKTGLIDSYATFKEKRKNGEDLKIYMSQSNHPNEKGHHVVAELILNYFFNETQWNEYYQKQTVKIMKKVADWQLMNFENQVRKGSQWTNSHAYWAWTNATMYIGMAEWAEMSDDPKYWNFLLTIGEKNQWQTGPSIYFADDICIIQPYAMLFNKYKEPRMIKKSVETLDTLIANPRHNSLSYYADGSHSRWCWCDALFMAPTSFARIGKATGEPKYLEFMDKELRITYDSLYSATDSLFFRDTRYINMREQNGEKVFWGRGNGWVTGALTFIIDNMPAQYPSRTFYISLFRQMMKKISTLQDKQGFWHSSLLDTISYPMPEASASGFFTYSLFWGLNHGYLEKEEYLPIAKKAWNALASVVHEDGKIGYVQPIGADPKKVDMNDTEVYGTGAFLLAATEYVKYLKHTK
ncbi:glycoside hydrolase family 88 protein [Bacteroides timonensis]|uniref:glycoside hydrolase family 88 protein n=1 Tax=Bacteroides timonensis TaxID=1470345 RepID=UPI0004ADDA04|nr:glycoside hydrolase family 88 protein [Bacteroides timonensis]